MDADDIMVPERLAKQYEFMQDHPNIDILTGAIQRIDANGQAIGSPISDNGKYISMADMADGCCMAHPTSFFRSSSISKYKYALYDPNFEYAEDYDLWVRLLADGACIYNMSDILVQYRLHPSQTSNTKAATQLAKTDAIRKRAIELLQSITNSTFNKRHAIPESNNDLTIVIPFLNEREEVRNTVESIRESVGDIVDIIVINDDSDKDYDYLSDLSAFNVAYVENTNRIGAALSKEKGVQLVKTPFFLILDAHMRFFDHEWATYIISELQKNPDRLLCSNSIPLSKDENGTVSLSPNATQPHGAYLVYESESYIPGIKWNNSKTKLDTISEQQIPCVLGAGYASSKSYWNKLMGLQGLMHYGCEEAYISIKAWREGGGCYLLPKLRIGHIYREKFPYQVYPTQSAYNYILIAETLFPTSEKCAAKAIAWKIGKEGYRKLMEHIHTNHQLINRLKKYYATFKGLDYEAVKRLSLKCANNEQSATEIAREDVQSIASVLTTTKVGISNLGLFSGVMAHFLCLLIYAEDDSYDTNDTLTESITKLWDSISRSLSEPTGISFFLKEGLAGIGWGLIYASSHNLLEDEISSELASIDLAISQIAPSRIKDTSLWTGLGGIYCYVVSRLAYNQRKNLEHAFDSAFLLELKSVAPQIIERNDDWRTLNYLLQFMEYDQTDWTILRPEFSDIADLPSFVPKQHIDWEFSLYGVIGSVIKKISNHNEEK
jgi:glycosyltransferase involved in cell wall biosynthesis